MAMFRRRRHTAPVLQAAPPGLSAEALLELINGKLSELIGADGQWTLVRRSGGDTDTIFHTMLTRQIAEEVAACVSEGVELLRSAPGTEPMALPWTPAPVAVWADAAPAGADVQRQLAA